jgi:hypothetical protein
VSKKDKGSKPPTRIVLHVALFDEFFEFLGDWGLWIEREDVHSSAAPILTIEISIR